MWFGDLNHPDRARACWATTAGTICACRLKEGEHRLLHHPHRRQGIVQGSGFVRAAFTTGCRCARVQIPSPSVISMLSQPMAWMRPGAQASTVRIFIIRSAAFSAAYPQAGLPGNRDGQSATGAPASPASIRLTGCPPACCKAAAPRLKNPTHPGCAWKTRPWRLRCSRWRSSPSQVYAYAEKPPPVHPHNKRPGECFKAHLLGSGHFLSALAPWRSRPSRSADLVPQLLFQWTWSLFLSTRSSSCSGSSSSSPCLLFGRGRSAAGCAVRLAARKRSTRSPGSAQALPDPAAAEVARPAQSG